MKLARAEVSVGRTSRFANEIFGCTKSETSPSDTYASDIPYWVRDPYAAVNGGEDDGMLMIPYSLCTNDHKCACAVMG